MTERDQIKFDELIGMLGRLCVYLRDNSTDQAGQALYDEANSLLANYKILPVRDGYVGHKTKVWWRSDDGPQLVVAEMDWGNIAEFPEAYQLAKPQVKITYES